MPRADISFYLPKAAPTYRPSRLVGQGLPNTDLRAAFDSTPRAAPRCVAFPPPALPLPPQEEQEEEEGRQCSQGRPNQGQAAREYRDQAKMPRTQGSRAREARACRTRLYPCSCSSEGHPACCRCGNKALQLYAFRGIVIDREAPMRGGERCFPVRAAARAVLRYPPPQAPRVDSREREAEPS